MIAAGEGEKCSSGVTKGSDSPAIDVEVSGAGDAGESEESGADVTKSGPNLGIGGLVLFGQERDQVVCAVKYENGCI